MLCHIPGLKVVYPSNPYDMKGLMTACIREDNPTVMVKHKRLLGMSRDGAGGAVRDPARQGAGSLRAGNDVTVVAYGRMANEALAAAEHARRRRASSAR